ncbi:MAG TPA: c-type cytochrome [Anaeromyxobacteraceae bacterium]
MGAGRSAALAALVAALCACEGRPPFREPQRLGGRVVPAEVLNRGWRVYRRSCRTCHGDRGDGRGPTGLHLDPPPRDLTSGLFKFGSVPAGALPTDDDLRRMVRDGLGGTGMLAWNLTAAEVADVADFVKTFSPRWGEEEPGQPVVPGPDPWAGRPGAGEERGRRLYHAAAGCLACHPAHAAEAEIAAWARELGREPPEPRPDPGAPVASDSDYGRRLRAPDFTRDELRSVRPGAALADLYRVVAAGVGGTAMPAWAGALPEEDLWALAHYVDGLARRRRPATSAPRGSAGRRPRAGPWGRCAGSPRGAPWSRRPSGARRPVAPASRAPDSSPRRP